MSKFSVESLLQKAEDGPVAKPVAASQIEHHANFAGNLKILLKIAMGGPK